MYASRTSIHRRGTHVYPHSRALQLQLRAGIQGQDVRTSGSRFVNFFDNFLEAQIESRNTNRLENHTIVSRKQFSWLHLRKMLIGIEHQTNRIVCRGLSI